VVPAASCPAGVRAVRMPPVCAVGVPAGRPPVVDGFASAMVLGGPMVPADDTASTFPGVPAGRFAMVADMPASAGVNFAAQPAQMAAQPAMVERVFLA
jgi:hypothetical protein